jgi:hypothetical protein
MKEAETGMWDQQPGDRRKKEKEAETNKRNTRRNVITKGTKIGMGW